MTTDIILRVNGTEYKQGTDVYNKYIQNEDGTPVKAGGGYVDLESAIITAPNKISKIVIIGTHKSEGENTYTKEFNPPKDKLEFYDLYQILDFNYPTQFKKMDISISEPTGGTGSEPQDPEPEPPTDKDVTIKESFILGLEQEQNFKIDFSPPHTKELKVDEYGRQETIYIIKDSTVITITPVDKQKEVKEIEVTFYKNYNYSSDVLTKNGFMFKDIKNYDSDSEYMLLDINPTLDVKKITEPETPDTPTEPESGNLFNIYSITRKNFIELLGIDSINESFTPIDNSYIVDFYNLPFNIDSIIHNIESSIKYGKYDSKVQAKPVLKDKIRVDLGNIEIPLKYNNSYDYNVNQVLLYLPLTEPVELDYKYIINSTINISYEIDLNNHKTNLVIKSSLLNNDIAYITNIDIIDSLLMINSKKEKTEYKTRSTVYNHIKTPYIQIIRNTPYFNDSMYYPINKGQEQTIFKNLSGYNELIDIDLKFKCNNLEKQELKTILKNGFRIEK